MPMEIYKKKKRFFFVENHTATLLTIFMKSVWGMGVKILLTRLCGTLDMLNMCIVYKITFIVVRIQHRFHSTFSCFAIRARRTRFINLKFITKKRKKNK